jgi:hypothetical protein
LAQDDETPSGTLGRIALKQVRVTREELEARTGKKSGGNPMNSLVPYLDLFARLDDAEMARLARVERAIVADLRRQVDEIDRALVKYVDLLPRLSDGELTRLTGASAKTIRFWRLCNARAWAEPGARGSDAQKAETITPRSHSVGGEATPGVPSETPVTRTPAPVQTSDPGLEGVVEPDPSPSPAPPSEPEAAPTLAGLDGQAQTITDDEDDIQFALIDDDEEHAVTQAQSATAPPTSSSEDEDDLAFELSDDDFF